MHICIHICLRNINNNIMWSVYLLRWCVFCQPFVVFVLLRFNAPGSVLTASGWSCKLKDCATSSLPAEIRASAD